MSDNKKYDELMKQLEAFEKTVSELASNIAKLKGKLMDNKEKYGADIAAWPKDQ
jgi:hypothetical protein